LLNPQIKDKGGEINFKFRFIDNLFPKLSRKQDFKKIPDSNENSEDRSPHERTR